MEGKLSVTGDKRDSNGRFLPVHMNKEHFAMLMQVSTRTVDKWVDKGMAGVPLKSGTSGKKWRIDFLQAVRSLAEMGYLDSVDLGDCDDSDLTTKKNWSLEYMKSRIAKLETEIQIKKEELIPADIHYNQSMFVAHTCVETMKNLRHAINQGLSELINQKHSQEVDEKIKVVIENGITSLFTAVKEKLRSIRSIHKRESDQ